MNIRLTQGTYKIRGRDRDCTGLTFPLVKPYNAAAGCIMVDGSAQPGFPDRNIKIRVDDADCFEEVTEAQARAATAEETDEEIIERMRDRFQMLEDMTKAAKRGDVRAMIVTGPPGVGKSHGVEKVLGKHDLLADIAGNDKLKKYEVVKGAMSAIGLYAKLYQYADKDNVLVFDDCDSVLLDDLSLNILKAALDSKQNRTIHWNTDSRLLAQEGIPNSFTFKGSAIFITNIKFENVRSKKLKDHLEALESRCHYIDLTIDTEREKMLRIKQIIGDGMLEAYDFAEHTAQEIYEFIDLNRTRLREISLRTVLKVADLVRAFPDRWESVAENTVMKRNR